MPRNPLVNIPGISNQAPGFAYELVFLHTLRGAGGKNLSERLISTLLLPLHQQGVFLISRSFNMQDFMLLNTMGLKRTGEHFQNADYTGHLSLYTLSVDTANVPIEFPIL